MATETSGKLLEEIDLVFLVGYVENRSYVEVANNLPKQTEESILQESHRLRAEYAARKGDKEEARRDIPEPGTNEA